MHLDPRTANVIKKAIEQEEKYNWLKAAAFYEEATGLESDAGSFAAETWEKIGFCYQFASTQADTTEDFRRIRVQAVEAYRRAAELFQKKADLKSQGKSAQCLTIAEYVHCWLASDYLERKKMLENCCALGKRSLEAYSNAGDQLSYGKMCGYLALCLLERLYVASEWEEIKNVVKEGMDYADKAIAALSKSADRSELLRAYYTASIQSWNAYISEEEDKRKELMQRSLDFSEKALVLSKEVDNPYHSAMTYWAAAFCNLLFTGKIESATDYATQMLQQGTTVKDNFLKGVASYILTFVTNWMILKEEDPDKKKEEHEKIIKHAEDAIRYLQAVSQDFFIAQTYWFYAETYSSLARDIASNLSDKRAISEKSIRIGRKGLEHAMRSGSPDAIGSNLHAVSKALQFCSNLETGKMKKIRLLEEALIHRVEYVKIVNKAFPYNDWILGVGKNYEGLIRAELSKLETENEKKIALLKSAVADMESGLLHSKKWLISRDVPTYSAAIGRFEDWFGEILERLYVMTQNKEMLIRATEVYSDAAEKFSKVNLSSRVAESYWKMAKDQDLIGDYEKAAENFEKASKEYSAAAQKIPHFIDFYLDYSTYMKAWSEIEKARFAHMHANYAAAMKHYQEAANLLEPTRLWSYLSSNFCAWSLLEQAEDLSRKENNSEAGEAFKKSKELFYETKKIFEAELGKIENVDERELAERLIEASETRGKYCTGRISIEEAKALDRQGGHLESSEKFEFAARTFEKIAETGSEQTRKEITPLVCLCYAWQKMMLGEAKSLPSMFKEAAELFLQAREQTLDQQTSLLAMGHSSFCRALEAGTEFENTRDAEIYSKAREHLGAAASYYLKAGFASGSEYVKATQLFFDAYMYMDSAKRETSLEKEARYYTMAEKVLKVSAESYVKAKHIEKAEQVQRLLKEVKEDRELALSLSEVLHAPAVTASTASFVMPAPSEERAVGLERFEHADVQVKLIPRAKEVRIGEDIDIEVQIANLGKEGVLLSKIEEIVPDGFQLVTKPEYCQSLNAGLDTNGRRLDPLKTEEIKLVLKSLEKGIFDIKPRIVCFDETGHQILRGPEPLSVTVSKAVLPGRVTTAHDGLDNLLLGGIPENYVVVLTSPSCDERDQIISSYLEAGVKSSQVTFHITTEASGVKALAQEFQSSFYLFICNPRADVMIENLPNVFKLKGIENLTEIDIALTKAFRELETLQKGSRRACIEIVSDVLLQHHAVSTRRWLTALIPDLRSRGFTALAVMNPLMHSTEEVHAILGLFDGEITIYEKETQRGPRKFLKIRKLHNQKYLDGELPLKKE